MENIKTKFKAVIFDMDGTIIKTDHIWAHATLGFLEECGIKDFSQHDKKMLEDLSGMNIFSASTVIKNHFGLTHQVNEIAARKMAIANEGFAKHVEFIEGFELFHEQLRKHNIPSGIATNATPENLNPLVKIMNFEHYFGNNIYCIAHVNYVPKPDPTLFFHVAERLGAKPEECIVFEDSIYGFQAAKAAGMKCIAIKNKQNAELLHHTDHAIDNYFDAQEALVKLIDLSK